MANKNEDRNHRKAPDEQDSTTGETDGDSRIPFGDREPASDEEWERWKQFESIAFAETTPLADFFTFTVRSVEELVAFREETQIDEELIIEAVRKDVSAHKALLLLLMAGDKLTPADREATTQVINERIKQLEAELKRRVSLLKTQRNAYDGKIDELLNDIKPLLESQQKIRETSKKGGKNKKPCLGIIAIIKQELLHNRKASNQNVWESIPESWSADPRIVIATNGRSFSVYRDGRTLVQIDERDKNRSIGRAMFDKYMTRIRKELPQR